MLSSTGIRVLIVDDHPVVCRGLMSVVGRQPDLVLVGAVPTLDQALQLCRTDPPDLILLDLRLPGTPSEQAVAQIQGSHRAARILLLSADEAGEDRYRALEAGAAGCVNRTVEPEELITAIRTVHAGEAWLASDDAEKYRTYRSGARLGDEELACLRLLAAGRNRRQIAAGLGWSERQVRDRMSGMQTKLGAQNETHMLVMALQQRIVALE